MRLSTNYSAAASTALRRVSVLVVLGALVITSTHSRAQVALTAPAGQPGPQTVDRTRLEIVEDLSESLANDLIELSVATRNRDARLTAAFIPPTLVSAPFLCRPLPIKPDVKWIGTHGWTAEQLNATAAGAEAQKSHGDKANAARAMSRDEFMRDWLLFLDHFPEIEDARFKVKAASFDESANSVAKAEVPTAVVGSKGTARVAFYVIGRNPDGQREWARGVADVGVRYAESKRWQFETFTLVSLDSMLATSDIFSEDSKPAGVAATIPAYGAPGNGGFVWHGAATADFNGDGWIDLFVTAADRNYLYLNDGRGHFQDASEEAGVKVLATGVAPLVLDYDSDGAPDVFISNVGKQVLLENRLRKDGKLEFRDVSLEAGIAVDAIGFSAIAGDVNGDGLPDIYVTSYNRYGQVAPNSWFRATNGTPNLLFINKGDGIFREEAARWGVDDRRWSYAAAFADVNGDGKLDLYVANDFGEKGLLINKGDHFVDEAESRGVIDPGNGMGVAFGDYNNDGRLDIFATNMSSTAGNRILSRLFPTSSPKDNVLKKLAAGNDLYENLGDGHYRDVTADVGGLSAGWAWGGGFVDFDNDGWEDVYTPNGFISGKSMKDT
ncbi:MAG: FG-GAP repeat domain-containing protein [Pyrinomonadaceae bacterium]